MNEERAYQTCIKNRNVLTLNGVFSVESFDEDFLTLDTALGELVIEGKELKIESLLKESGEILIVGEISGLFYRERKSEKRFFAKLFK